MTDTTQAAHLVIACHSEAGQTAPLARFRAFIDKTSGWWDEHRWGEKLATLQGLSILATQHAMLCVSQGTGGTGGTDGLPEDATTARAFGARIVRAAQRRAA